MPVQPSPAVRRAAAVLRALADDPGRRLSLAEISRAAGISRSSAHSTVLALVEDGLLSRFEHDLTYSLGPALAELGSAASEAIDLPALVAPELTRLREEHRVTALAGVAAADHVVVLDARPGTHPLGYTVAPGARLPLRAPIGPVYVAWSDRATIDGWLDRAETPLDERRRTALEADLARIRGRGWSASVRRSRPRDGGPLTGEATARDLRAAQLEVIGISSPVMGSEGEVVCSVALAAFAEHHSGAEISAMGESVRAAAGRVSARLFGGIRRWSA